MGRSLVGNMSGQELRASTSRCLLLCVVLLAPACGGGGGVNSSGHVAELSTSATAIVAGTSTGPELKLVLPAGTAATTFQTDLAVISSSSTGDSGEAAEIALRFQPVADRATGYTNALYLRIEVFPVPGGLVAKRFYYECLEATSCSTTSSVGLMTSGNWGNNGVVVQQGTVYQAAISWLPATAVVTFTLSRGGTMIGTANVDLHQGSTSSPVLAAPFDVSTDSYMRGFLTALAFGGATGGGDAAIVSHFDNVEVGTDGAAPALFDDFEGETIIDSTKWSVTGSQATIAPG
jgi:hypothetical protein